MSPDKSLSSVPRRLTRSQTSGNTIQRRAIDNEELSSPEPELQSKRSRSESVELGAPGDAGDHTVRGPRQRATLPVPVPNITKKSRGRRVPTKLAISGASGSSPSPARTYGCKVKGCGKLFHRGEHLKRHIRSIHTMEKPFQCTHPACEKFFNRHDNLLQHLKVHKDFTPEDAAAAAVAGRRRSKPVVMSRDGTPATEDDSDKGHPSPSRLIEPLPDDQEANEEGEPQEDSKDDDDHESQERSVSPAVGPSTRRIPLYTAAFAPYSTMYVETESSLRMEMTTSSLRTEIVSPTAQRRFSIPGPYGAEAYKAHALARAQQLQEGTPLSQAHHSSRSCIPDAPETEAIHSV